MPVSQAQKQRTRERIVNAAAAWFRDRGFKGATIDDMMGAADLTRGTFYAHFASKEALFAEVIATRHDLLQRLKGRQTGTDEDLRRQGREILGDYVAVENHDAVGPNCTLSTLAADVGRTGEETREAFGSLLESFGAEIARGYEGKDMPSFALLSMVVGGVLLAYGCRGTETQQRILRQCQRQIDVMLGTE